MYFKLMSIAVLAVLCICKDVMSYKILVVCPAPAKSHNILGRGIADILHNANHEITYVTSFPLEKSKYREIGVPITTDAATHSMLDFEKLATTSAVEMLMQIPAFTKSLSEGLYQSKDFQNLLKDKNEKFDLIVIEYTLNDGLAGLGVRFDCPVTLVSSVSPMHWLARRTGNPVSPASVPNGFLSFNGAMTFPQRFLNTIMALVQELFGSFYNDKIQEEIYKRYLPEEAAKVPFFELYKKIALVLSNSHPSLGNPRPLLPNTIEVAGYHISDSKSLPEEYQKILDNATNGVIFFSMGSNLKSAEIPSMIKSDILKSLSKRKETILWKYEEDLPNKPNNVIIRSWMPQASILGHPNVKLFITHGGLLSTTEAVVAGVPVLSIPIFGDQFLNAQATQHRGCGVTLQYSNLTESSLTWALNEVIDNTKYTINAKKTHRLFHDRPIKPKDLVAFYAEHVIRTGGAKHLSAPHLPLYSSLLLDVIVVLLLPPLLLILVTIWMCKKCCGTSKSQIKPKQKKN